MALVCFQERYLFGLSVLDVDMRRLGRKPRRATAPEAVERKYVGVKIGANTFAKMQST